MFDHKALRLMVALLATMLIVSACVPLEPVRAPTPEAADEEPPARGQAGSAEDLPTLDDLEHPWAPQSSGTTIPLFGVWGSSGSDVFAVGLGGPILHYDGISWTPQTSGTTSYLRGVWGSSSSDVLAVGAGGIILHQSITSNQS